MIDEITEQAMDIIFSNKKLKDKIYPIMYCVIGFNLILLLLVVYIAVRVFKLNIVNNI